MSKFKTFSQFLRSNYGGDEVNPILSSGILHSDFPGTKDTNNLFAVSQHFMKAANDDPETILKALVSAYHRWILGNMREMSKSLERCIAANRVVFIEDNSDQSADVGVWQDLNQTLTDLNGNVQDFSVASNYALLQNAMHEEQHE